MVNFKRYPHINDLFTHYVHTLNAKEVADILYYGVTSEESATQLCRFVWQMVEAINEDEENQIEVLGSCDNTEMLPDLSYEITKLMRDTGYYPLWEKISREESE